MREWASFVVCFLLIPPLVGFKIDNSIVNQRPRLECLSNSIVVHVQTAGPFFGRVFVKNHAHEPECTIRGDGQTTLASLHLPFEHCFLRRQRVLAPKAGVIVTTTIVVSFHPFVLTAADGAFRVQCVYLSDRQHLGASLAIASLSTPLFSSPLPRCKYEILEGGPNGHVIPMASVGAKVFHKWSCQAEKDKFCAMVHSCKVEDGNGTDVVILDERGCSKDPLLLPNLSYLDDLTAGQKAQVFKFADRLSLFFQCQVMITRKEEGGRCVRPTCPNIPQPNGRFDVVRGNPRTFVNFDRRSRIAKRSDGLQAVEGVDVDVLSELDVYEFGPADFSLDSSSLSSADEEDAMCSAFDPLIVLVCFLFLLSFLSFYFVLKGRREVADARSEPSF